MQQISWIQIVAILSAGLLAGIVNTLAGGGSFLTLAALEFAGLPALDANGTNRLAILIQNIAAVMGFRSKGVSNFRESLHYAIPALFGAILGARIVIGLPEQVFHRILAIAMLAMLLTLVLDPKRRLQARSVEMTTRRRWIGYGVFFVVGIYGGAIQAGVGFLLITSLVLISGLDLVRTNSHKVFIVGVYTVFALLMFALQGHVRWLLGLVLAAGNASGGWLASRLAVERGERFVRVVLGVALVVLAIRYLGLIPGF